MCRQLCILDPVNCSVEMLTMGPAQCLAAPFPPLSQSSHRCILDPGDCSVEVLTMGKLMANTNAGVKG